MPPLVLPCAQVRPRLPYDRITWTTRSRLRSVLYRFALDFMQECEATEGKTAMHACSLFYNSPLLC